MANFLQIANLELQMPIQDFETDLQWALDEYNNAYSEEITYAIKPMSTKHGKHMYKLTLANNDCAYMHIVAEQDSATGDIIFHPLKLSNFHDSFYGFEYPDEDIIGERNDPAEAFCHAMVMICQKHKDKGNCFAYIASQSEPRIIKNGDAKRSASIAIVDGDGNIYSCAGAKSIKGASDSVDFTVQKPIGEWLKEYPDVQREIAKLPAMDAKMNYIGKYLINAKLAEEIDSDEFIDIFCQAGIIGFSEPSIMNIYKLIM